MEEPSHQALLPSDRGLAENLLRFCRLLRQNGFRVGLASALQAAAGLRWVDPTDLSSFRVLLAATLVSSREEMERFWPLFDQYWLGRARKEEGGAPRTGTEGQVKSPDQPLEGANQAPGPKAYRSRGALYSPHSGRASLTRDLQPIQDSPRAREAIRSLLRLLAAKPSRRIEPSNLGRRFSFRRTMRRSLQYGGDLLYLELLDPRLRPHQVVFLCDVSGSMDEYTRLTLEFAHDLLMVERRAELFLFSTELVRATPLVRGHDLKRFLLQLPKMVPQWGAGTRIGHCLRCLREEFGSTLLARRPVVVIHSDGWDQGEIELLEREMAFLRRRSRAIVWLNPLLGTQGYEPTCRGMAAALPYLDLFLPPKFPKASPLHALRGLGPTHLRPT